jgi:hypothetical protein
MAYRTFLVPFSVVPINHRLTAFPVLEVPRNLETGWKARQNYEAETLEKGSRCFAIVFG